MPLNEDNSVLSAFRQMGYEPSFARKRGSHGTAMSLQELTDNFLNKFKAKNPDIKMRIERDWSNIVGSKFCNKCAPSNIRLGILYITASSPAIKQELLFMQRTLMANIGKIDTAGLIKNIRIL